MNTEETELFNQMKHSIFRDVFHVTNDSKGSGFKIRLSDKDKPKAVKTKADLLSIVYKNSQELQGLPGYREFLAVVTTYQHEQRISFEDAWKDRAGMIFDLYIAEKNEAIENCRKSTLPTAFGAKLIPSNMYPSSTLNDADMEILEGLCFCPKEQNFWYRDRNNYRRIGNSEELSDRHSTGIQILNGLINDHLTEKYGAQFDFWNMLYERADRATDDYFRIESEMNEALRKKMPLEGIMIQTFWMKKPMELKEFLKIPNSPLPFDYTGRLHSAMVKGIINYGIPAAAVNYAMISLNYEQVEEWFYRYNVSPAGQSKEKKSMTYYLSKLFEDPAQLIARIPKLKVIPRTISDTDGIPSNFHIIENWQDKLKDQFAGSECKMLKVFLSPYSLVEKIAIMGWAYTVFHTSLNELIGFLFMTGGGTFKTNYFTKMLEKILDLMYRPSYPIVHKMIKDYWIKDPALKENADGTGISTAALVVNDEATEKALDEYKGMSGGSADTGMPYQKRVMRSNPYQINIFGTWLFTTNNEFSIKDNTGAFDRRLFMIKHMDVKNLTPPYTRGEYNEMMNREIKAFYELAKKCYEKAVEESGSFINYVSSKDVFTRNLKEAYNELDKTKLYIEFFNDFYDRNPNNRREDGSIFIKPADLRTSVETMSKSYGINNDGMMKWIKTTEKTIKPNKNKFSAKKNQGSFWLLYPLKDEFINEVVDDDDLPGIAKSDISEYDVKGKLDGIDDLNI